MWTAAHPEVIAESSSPRRTPCCTFAEDRGRMDMDEPVSFLGLRHESRIPHPVIGFLNEPCVWLDEYTCMMPTLTWKDEYSIRTVCQDAACKQPRDASLKSCSSASAMTAWHLSYSASSFFSPSCKVLMFLSVCRRGRLCVQHVWPIRVLYKTCVQHCSDHQMEHAFKYKVRSCTGNWSIVFSKFSNQRPNLPRLLKYRLHKLLEGCFGLAIQDETLTSLWVSFGEKNNYIWRKKHRWLSAIILIAI